MNHIVCLDTVANEIEKLLSGKKKMIIRGAAGRKLPYGRVMPNDILYFINNNADEQIMAKAVVKSVFNSEKMSQQESIKLVEENQNKLYLTDKQFNRWAGKRYLVLIEIINITKIIPFVIDKSNYGNMNDWLLIEKIATVKNKTCC